MSKSLTIGTCTFQYPEAGTKPGWGEEAACWAEAVTNKIATLSGPNDICTTSVSITNNQCTAANIGSGVSALSFSTSAVRSFVATYAVIRGSNAESGELEGVWNGTSWALTNSFTGCAGMCFQITTAGQIQYFSDCSSAGTIKFRARTIDQ